MLRLSLNQHFELIKQLAYSYLKWYIILILQYPEGYINN